MKCGTPILDPKAKTITYAVLVRQPAILLPIVPNHICLLSDYSGKKLLEALSLRVANPPLIALFADILDKFMTFLAKSSMS